MNRIDLSKLKLIVGSDESQFAELLKLFVTTSSRLIAELDAAVARGDLPAVGRISHSLKGSAGVIGAQQLYDHLEHMEKWARAPAKQAPDMLAVRKELDWVVANMNAREGHGVE
jgi:HPt (histidine-containing phosphotransfer) domain-containing protein